MTIDRMWRGTLARLAAGCALSLTLAAGCAGEELGIEPDERPDDLERGWATGMRADAGVAHPAPGYAPCEADAGLVHDASAPYPPEPVEVDAGLVDDASVPYPPKPVEADAGLVYDAAAFQDCFGAWMGDGKTCRSNLDLKLDGQALCAAKGFALADMKLGESDCAGGSTEGWVSCCTSAPRPIAPPAACTEGVIGDGSKCLDSIALHREASAACEALGAELTALAGPTSDPCPLGVLIAKYQCCKDGALPPEPIDPTDGPWLK